ncbi:MAG TPA: hypothetical protein VLJ20_09695 [Acetobacteraceae bacterium]|nr:hypothetical protein [Acetobacteraceae bacterium]
MSAFFRLLPVLLLAALLAGCGHPTSADLTQLQSFQTADDRTVATATIACDAADPVCARLQMQQGAACERLSEAQSAAERAAMRACALQAFRKARALLPANASDADRLAATRGLANALKIARDNEMNATTRQQDEAELDQLLPALAALPGGASYAGYYRADAALNRVLTKETDAAAACGALRSAQAELPGAPLPADLAQRVPALRGMVEGTMRQRSCT